MGKVLIACEFSGRTRRAFQEMGHEVISADFLPSEDNSDWHYQGDCFDLINDLEFDLMIAHPPCTYLASSGLHWNTRGAIVDGVPRAQLTEEALEFVRRLMNAPIPKIAIENPVGCIGTRIRKADQIVHPYMFGDDASKATCLWLKGLPLLTPTKLIEPRIVEGKKRWGNQWDDGTNNVKTSKDRAKIRSITFQGMANAFAAQWG